MLQGRFDPDSFTPEVVDVAQKLVPLTVTLWNKVSAKMLPTPAKFHYLFNMRELSKVGLLCHVTRDALCVAPTHFAADGSCILYDLGMMHRTLASACVIKGAAGDCVKTTDVLAA